MRFIIFLLRSSIYPSLPYVTSGVNPKILRVGEKVAAERELGQQAFSKRAYFSGKMVWAKEYREVINLLTKHKNGLEGFKLDVFGNGEHAQEAHRAAKKLDLILKFLKGRDHADDSLHSYDDDKKSTFS